MFILMLAIIFHSQPRAKSAWSGKLNESPVKLSACRTAPRITGGRLQLSKGVLICVTNVHYIERPFFEDILHLGLEVSPTSKVGNYRPVRR